MLDLCVADQIFSCCNQTCLVKGCQGKTDALGARLPLPSAVQDPLLPQPAPSCVAAPGWREAAAACCMWQRVSRQASLEGSFPRQREYFPQRPVPIAGEGGIARPHPGGLGALQVSVALRGRTGRNPTFALHLYRYCCLSIC